MTTEVDASLILRTEIPSSSYKSCSFCSSTGHFDCFDHCQAIFCTKCARKHRNDVLQEMRQLHERLKFHRTHSAGTSRGSMTDRSIHTHYCLSRDAETITKRSTEFEINQSIEIYLSMLDEYIQHDRLFDAENLRKLHELVKDERISRNDTDINRRSSSHSPFRQLSARGPWRKSITVALNRRKTFELAIKPSFSVGQHPVIVSLTDQYLETTLCEWRENTVMLISATSIDIYMRGIGLKWSIPLIQVLHNIKDNILAGVWSLSIERIVLVGRYDFYIFDIDHHKVLSVCRCGCGGRCGSGSIRPKNYPNKTMKYPCPEVQRRFLNSKRFLACNQRGYLFYAYQIGLDTYKLQAYSLSFSSSLSDQKSTQNSSVDYEQDPFYTIKMQIVKELLIDGHLAAMCITHNHVAVVYRRFQRVRNSKIVFVPEHYFALYDHSFNQLVGEVRLDESIRWVTAITSYGTEFEFVICDPRGQQLLLYEAKNNTLNRRFRIGPVNACCLGDGRLVLWIKKAYATTPISQLHFISAPHLQNHSTVSKSMNVLNRSTK